MSDLFKYTRRVLTALLSAAMVLTSLPLNAYAAEADTGAVVTQTQEAVAEAGTEAAPAEEKAEVTSVTEETGEDLLETDTDVVADEFDGPEPDPDPVLPTITVSEYENGKLSDWPDATSIGSLTVTEPSEENGNIGSIQAAMTYSTGNYASDYNEMFDWHPMNTSGFYPYIVATVSDEEYLIGYSFSADGTGALHWLDNNVFDYATARPWFRDGQILRLAAKKKGTENIVVDKKYLLDLDNYDGTGPVSTDLGETDYWGKKAADLQDVEESDFNPVPESESGLFDYGDFKDGSKYGGEGFIKGKLTYQESYPGWGAPDGGYFFAFKVNSDTLYEHGTELDPNYKASLYVATSIGEPYEPGKEYGWRKLDDDKDGVWKISKPGSKLVVKKTFLNDLWSGSTYDTSGDKDIYYVYDLLFDLEKVIKFDANGGEGTMPIMRNVDPATDDLPGNTFTKEGYTFYGWTVDPADPTSPLIEDRDEIRKIDETFPHLFDNGVATLYAVYKPVGVNIGATAQNFKLFQGAPYEIKASELQKADVVVDKYSANIVGTLKKVNGWTAYGANTSTGHFLALTVSTPGALKIEAGADNYTELDDDGTIAIRIRNKDEQKAKVKVTYLDGTSDETFLDLSKLTLEGFELDTDIPEDAALLGKELSDLQDGDLWIENNTICGDLNYVADYTSAGFAGAGYYLVVHSDVEDGENAYIINNAGDKKQKIDPEDGLIILQIPEGADLAGKKIQLQKEYANGSVETRNYSLEGLNLQDPDDTVVVSAAPQDLKLFEGTAYEKTTSDFQEDNIVVREDLETGDKEIVGTLKKVTGWTAYGADMNSGHFLVLHIDAPGATKIEAGADSLTALDADGIIAIRIRDKDEQEVKVKVTYATGEPETFVYDISGLTLEGFGLDTNVPKNESFWGKTLSDLQNGDLSIEDDTIYGQLKYVYDYSAAFGPTMNKGYYLAIHAPIDKAAGETASVINEKGEVWPIDPNDGLTVLYIGPTADLDGKFITLKKTYASGAVETRKYSLEGLTLQQPDAYELTLVEDGQVAKLYKAGAAATTFSVKATVTQGEGENKVPVPNLPVIWQSDAVQADVTITPAAVATDANGVVTASITIDPSAVVNPENIIIGAVAAKSDAFATLEYEVFRNDPTTQDVDLNLTTQSEYVFTPTFQLAPGSDYAIAWAVKEGEQSVASIDPYGVVTALKNGTAHFTQMVVNDQGKPVDVYGNPDAPEADLLKAVDKYSVNIQTAIERIEIAQNKDIFANGEASSDALQLTIYPNNYTSTGEVVAWTSSNTDVATIAGDGLTPTITGKSKGATTITATMTFGTMTLRSSKVVRVIPKVSAVLVCKQGDWENKAADYPPSGGNVWMVKGEQIKLSATIEATDPDCLKVVSWKTTDPEIATVDASGTVTALRGGVADIKVGTADGTEAVAHIGVTEPAESISATMSSLVLEIGQSVLVDMLVEPARATTYFTSSDSDLVQTFWYGNALEIKAGTKTGTDKITVEDELTGKKIEITVTVGGTQKPIESLATEKDSYELYETQSVRLGYKATPADYNNTNLTWDKSGEAADDIIVDYLSGVVTVVENPANIGKTALVKLTAKTIDGKKVASLNYTIKIVKAPRVETAVVDPKYLALKAPIGIIPGETAVLTAKLYPETVLAKYKAYKWESENPMVATVGELTGIVTAKDEGLTKINLLVYQGGTEYKKMATVQVAVIQTIDDDDYATGRYNPNGPWIGKIDEYTYTGVAIKPEPNVYYGDVLLAPGVDYKLGYKNNTNAARTKNEPTVTATLKGNYAGSVSQTFVINQASLDDVVVNNISAVTKDKRGAYTEQLLKPTLTFNGKALKAGTDFDLFYMDDDPDAYAAPGTWGINIYGRGNFTGEAYAEEVLVSKAQGLNISKAAVSGVEKKYYYTGNAIDPAPVVKFKQGNQEITLVEGDDYLVTYDNNVNIGKATITITGINGTNGAFYGSKKVTFKIDPWVTDLAKVAAAENIEVEIDDAAAVILNNGSAASTAEVAYSKGGPKPAYIWLKHNGKDMIPDVDYAVTNKYDARNNVASITITGKGKFYKGKATVTYNVVKQDISKMTFVVDDYVYTNKADGYKKNKITLYDLDGKALKEKTDYVIGNWETEDGSSVPAVGSYVTATITGAGMYDDTTSTNISFRVIDKDHKLSSATNAFMVDGEEIAASKFYVKYAGSPVTLTEDDIVLKVKKKVGRTVNVITLDPSEYEVVAFQNNNKVGTATMIVRGTGELGGLKNISFKIKK